MAQDDLILDPTHTPGFDEINAFIREPGRELWQEMTAFLEENYQVSPKIAYSRCSGKPGWNVKYQKSGKSLCTLYPERESFVALVVVTLDLVAFLEGMLAKFEPVVAGLLQNSKPFNGTLWLMIPVANHPVLENVKTLLYYKQPPKKVKLILR